MRNILASNIAVIFALAWSASAGERAYVTNQNDESMSIIDLVKRVELQRIHIPGHAAGVAVDSVLGRVYTVGPDDRYLREFDMNGNPCRALLLSGGPIAVAIDPLHSHAFVSDWYNAHIFVVDLKEFRLKTTLTTGAAPSGLAISANSKILASADRDSDQVSLFDTETLSKIAQIDVGQRPYGLWFEGDETIYVTNVLDNSVSQIDTHELEVTDVIKTGERPYGVVVAGGKIFVTEQYNDNVSAFDETRKNRFNDIDTGEYPEGIDRNREGHEIYVANWFSNTLSVVDTRTNEVTAQIPTGDGPRAFGKFVGEYNDNTCTAN